MTPLYSGNDLPGGAEWTLGQVRAAPYFSAGQDRDLGALVLRGLLLTPNKHIHHSSQAFQYTYKRSRQIAFIDFGICLGWAQNRIIQTSERYPVSPVVPIGLGRANTEVLPSKWRCQTARQSRTLASKEFHYSDVVYIGTISSPINFPIGCRTPWVVI